MTEANCQLTGKPHTLINQEGSLYCLDCKQKIESCCEGEAGREAQDD